MKPFLFLLLAPLLTAASIDDLQRSFQQPPPDARIMMRWWWFGPSVTKPQLEREMRLMKEAGIGGFEIQPVYPLALDDTQTGLKNLPYLSDEFIDALRFTGQKARELGLRVDLTLGSGWPFGGPHIPVNQAAARLRIQRATPEPAIGDGEQLISAAGDQVFIASRTGQMVKRAAVGAEGFVLDHYSRAAVDNHLATVGDRLMQAFGSNPPYAIFCDSLEAYGGDWTADLLEQFQQRRGYDLKPLLPVLANDQGEQTLKVRNDWGRTLTELYLERFMVPLSEWAKRNRTLVRIQGYGMPPAAISSYARADLPEGEGHEWKRLSTSRWASSAAHLFDRPVTSSETWTWLHSPSFRATPLDVKAEADIHFLQGINQLIGHGWPYTPEGAAYPGWRFYAAAVFDEKNPWWIVMPDLSAYLQRVSWILRQGRPANDVGIYLSNNDGWSRLSPGHVDLCRTLAAMLGPDLVARIIEAGYQPDFFDDETLPIAAQRYKIIVIPNFNRIPAATQSALDAFARNGGILIDTRQAPSFAPKLLPDVALSPGSPEVGFIHRSTGAEEIYFLANTGNQPRRLEATFRVDNLNAESWDPITGLVSPAQVLPHSGRGVKVALDLPPYGSRILVFSKRALPKPSAPSASASPIDISGQWTVTFPSGASTYSQLHSWTADASTLHFSGQAAYEKDVTIPAGFLQSGLPVRLDLGEAKPAATTKVTNGMQAGLDAPVREAAVVYVNGQRAGSVWCPPYSLDVTAHLKPGPNRLRIVVANTAINYMAGHPLPDYRLLNLRYGVRFEPQDMDKVQPVPSGLLGPIRLITGN